jgi:hypothetical protein
MQSLRRIYRQTVLTLAAACLLSTPVLAHPGSGIAVDRLGQVYFVDTGSGLWKIDAHGKLVQISRTMFHWLAIDPNFAPNSGQSCCTLTDTVWFDVLPWLSVAVMIIV